MQLDIAAEIPEKTISDFLAACDKYRIQLGNSQKVAVRRGVIAFLKSVRAKTMSAKQFAPLSDIRKYTGPGPHYITPKSGAFKGVALHRYTKAGFKNHQPYTFTYIGTSRQDVRNRHGKRRNWGLAKQSWGWFMQSLFNQGDAPKNKNLRITGDMVETSGLREIVTGAEPRVEVTLTNKLSYIRHALPGGALAAAMQAATNSINKQMQRKLEEAKKELQP